MQTYECPGCGNIITEGEECCKYCGNANPIYVTPRRSFFTPTPTSDTTANPQASVPVVPRKKFSGLLFIILLIFFWPGAIIYLIIYAISNGVSK